MSCHLTGKFTKIFVLRGLKPITYSKARSISLSRFDQLKKKSDDGSDGQDSPKAQMLKQLNDRLFGSGSAFKLFNVEEKLIIDMRKLRDEMIKLQNQLHPDRFVNEESKIIDQSQLMSSYVNSSYLILKDPYERAKYLLCIRKNMTSAELEARLDRLRLDPEFLAEMMKINETIEESTPDSFSVLRLQSKLSQDIEKIISEMEKDLEGDRYDDMLVKLAKLKFLSNRYQESSRYRGNDF